MIEKNRKQADVNEKQKKPSDLKISEIEVIKESIKKGVKQEIKSWLWKPISIFLIIAGFFGITTYTGIKQLQDKLMVKATEDFEEKINTLYSKKNVGKIVDELVKENTENLIKEKVKEEIDPVIANLKKDQEEYSNTLSKFRQEQQKYAAITLVSELSIKAEHGDRWAFMELCKIADLTNTTYSSFASQVAKKVYLNYFGKEYISEHYKPEISNSEVIRRLKDDHNHRRKLAVRTVSERKMYDQVPVLISMVRSEADLYVLGELQRVLNRMLDMKIKVLEEDAAGNFMRAWEEKKDQLLGNKQND